MDKHKREGFFCDGQPLFRPLFPYIHEKLKPRALPAPIDKPCTCRSGYFTTTTGPSVVKCQICGGRQKVNRFGNNESK